MRHPETRRRARKVYIAPISSWYEIEQRDGAEWHAGYSMPVNAGKGGMKTAFVVLNDIRSEECPRSVLIRNPQLERVVEMFSQEQILKGLGSPAKWPASLYDAFLLLSDQQEIDRHARDKAISELS